MLTVDKILFEVVRVIKFNNPSQQNDELYYHNSTEEDDNK